MKSNEMRQINEKRSPTGGLMSPPISKGPHTRGFVKIKQILLATKNPESSLKEPNAQPLLSNQKIWQPGPGFLHGSRWQ